MELNLDDVVNILEAKKTRNGWIARCPAHDDNTPSLAINQGENNKVLVFCHAQCSQTQVINRIRELLGGQIKPNFYKRLSPQKTDFHSEIWEEALALTENSSAAIKYLTKRGLSTVLPEDSIKFCPSLRYDKTLQFPAILFPIRNQNGLLVGIQRIFLSDDGQKAPVENPKKVLGQVSDGAIHFGPPCETVHIAEGPETTLAVYQSIGGYCLSLISANGIKNFQPNSKIKNIHIWADRDKSETGQKVAKSLAEHLFQKGFKVYIHTPPIVLDERKSIDWLDVLNDLGSEAFQNSLESEVPFNAFDLKGFPQPKGLDILLQSPAEEFNFLVDQLLIKGGTSLLVAKPKVGKSTAARQIAASISSGQDIFGRSSITGKVLYLALEEMQSQVKKHFETLPDANPSNILVHCGSAPKEAMEWLKMLIQSHKPDIVIIDPLFRFFRTKDSNSYSEINGVFEPFVELARKTNTHVMVVHHAKKGPGGNGGDDILGSTAIFGAVDVIITLRKNKEGRLIESEHRYGTPIEESILLFDEATQSVTIAGTKLEFSKAKIEKDIIEYLEKNKFPIDEEEIKKNIEARTGTFRMALRNLVSTRKVQRLGNGHKLHPFKYHL